MDFSFLGLVNRVLQMCKQTFVSSFSGVALGDDAYNGQIVVNDTIKDLSNLLRIKTRLVTFSFSTVTNQRLYVVPKRVIFPIYSLRQSNSDIKLKFMNTQEFDFRVPDDESYGDPEVYYMEQYAGVSSQAASTGEAVYCVSSSGSDTATVVIQGYNTDDLYVSEEVSLSGTSAVNTTNSFVHIAKISKPTTVGTITFRNSGSTTTFLKLAPTESSASLLTIGLHPMPSSVMTINGRGWSQIPTLVNEYDVPVGLSEEHINAVILGSYARYLRYGTTTKFETVNGAFQAYYDEVEKIISRGQRNPDEYKRMKHSNEVNRHLNSFNPLERNY